MSDGDPEPEVSPETKAEEEPEEPSVDIVINNVVGSFSVGCHLDLREIARVGKHVEYKKENAVSRIAKLQCNVMGDWKSFAFIVVLSSLLVITRSEQYIITKL